MELKKYINENIVAKLKEKGLSEDSITEKIKEFIKEREEIGFEGDALKLSVKNRIKGYFSPILRSNSKSMKAIIFALSEVYDDNGRIRKMSELKKGMSGYKPDTSYVVKEGFYPWGNQQGKEIPFEPDYNQDGFIGIEYQGKLYYKNVKFSGNWLNDSDIKKASSGDVIKISLDPNKMDKNMVYPPSYEHIEQLNEDKYKTLINENLKNYHKTIEQIVKESHKGFTIVKGSVSDIEGGQYGFSFDIIDDPDSWDIENSLTASMNEVPFIAGSDDLIFIGDVFKKTNMQGYSMKVQNVIVPDKYKKKDLPKENLDIIEESFNNDLSSDIGEIDDDLL